MRFSLRPTSLDDTSESLVTLVTAPVAPPSEAVTILLTLMNLPGVGMTNTYSSYQRETSLHNENWKSP
jgi:hypothetical protein